MEQRDIKPIIDAVTKDKNRRGELASLRFYAEVFDGKTVSAPLGSPPTTLGAWSDNDALMRSETQIGSCATLLTGEKLQKASALSKEFGDALPVVLRAFTLASEGKKDDAATLFTSTLEGSAAPAECPGEHPMYSYRRVSRMTALLGCVKAIAPSRDVKKLEKLRDHAQSCASNNHAVG